jgi:hypothetical protein
MKNMKTAIKEKVCPKCGRIKTNPADLVSIEHAKECLDCDHVEVE